jgi:Flp pilus assembly protein CpaB
MPVTVRCRNDNIAPSINTTARLKVGRVNAIENAEISGSAALGIRNISDSFPVRMVVATSEDTGESDLFKVCSHKNTPKKWQKSSLGVCRIAGLNEKR